MNMFVEIDPRVSIGVSMKARSCHFAHPCATRQRKLSQSSQKSLTSPDSFSNCFRIGGVVCDLRTFFGVRSMSGISYRNVFRSLEDRPIFHRWWSRPPIAGEGHWTLLVQHPKLIM